MGGTGSGRWYRWDSKATTESQRSIDVRCLKKKGYLKSGIKGSMVWSRRGEKTGSISFRMEAEQMVLSYSYQKNGGKWENVEQAISFSRTACNYGGHRSWFVCTRCWRKVALLYDAGKYFYCRRCHNLTYATQQENFADRMARKADNIRDRMGWGPGILSGVGQKPTGMHWHTYNRLCAEHQAYVEAALETIGWI